MSVNGNVKCVILFLGLAFGLYPAESSNSNYRFDYRFQMDMEGKLVYLISYRFYYEAAASVQLKAWKDMNGDYRFCFQDVGGPGYVMSTGGLNGSSLYFFTADYDLKRAEEFREKKIVAFNQSEPYYSENIKKIRRRPMEILSHGDDSLNFSRSHQGVHRNVEVNVNLSDSHSYTYSFIHRILGRLLEAYNHSFLPQNGLNAVETGEVRVWYSKPLDFSSVLQETARLTSENAEKRAKFKQKSPFRVTYRLLSMDEERIEICGDCEPDVGVWRKMKIRKFSRYVLLSREEDVILKDEVFLDFRDKKGRGGTVILSLKCCKGE